jgi:flagellar biosynthesis GTPase FlhF
MLAQDHESRTNFKDIAHLYCSKADNQRSPYCHKDFAINEWSIYTSIQKSKKSRRRKGRCIREDMESGRTKISESTPIQPSSDIILKDEETISLNERLAQEIIQNGIECEAMTNTGSLSVTKKACYSYLYAMSPRIITNRGCIRLPEGNGSRNINFIQIVQKN